jgi:predicted PhzF superfamily epimerase YddE/YHI9
METVVYAQMAHPLFIVDAFTSKPFAGNPAAVVILERPADAHWMQQVAAEMKHAETAFVSPRPDGSHDLRWFTPAIEVDLCGHATLAAAHVMWHAGVLAPDREARFHTKSGCLSAIKDGESIRMDFPSEPASEVTAHPNLEAALGQKAEWVGQNRMDLLVQLPHSHDVRSLGPRMAAIAMLGGRGVIVTAPSDDPAYDFISRFFAPAAGVPEDDATGSAHCALAPYWGEKLGKKELTGYQASKRGAVIGVALKGDRVDLIGRAVVVVEGKLLW